MTIPAALHHWQPSSHQRRLRDTVARAFHVPPESLPAASRHRTIVTARHAACYVLREVYPELSYPLIGVLMGGRDHSTAIHGYRHAQELRRRDPVFCARVDALVEGGRMLRDQAVRLTLEQERAHVRELLAAMALEERPASEPDSKPPAVKGGKVALAAVAPVRDVKEKNALCPDDKDALSRHAGSIALAAALKAARPGGAA